MVAHITADEKLITDAQSAVDLMMTVRYEAGVGDMVISKKVFLF